MAADCTEPSALQMHDLSGGYRFVCRRIRERFGAGETSRVSVLGASRCGKPAQGGRERCTLYALSADSDRAGAGCGCCSGRTGIGCGDCSGVSWTVRQPNRGSGRFGCRRCRIVIPVLQSESLPGGAVFRPCMAHSLRERGNCGAGNGSGRNAHRSVWD